MRAAAPLALLLAAACAAPVDGQEVLDTLDRFHRAASEADGATYFELFAADGVFIGTAPGERWDVAAFRAYAGPYFDEGRGWTYTPRAGERHVGISDDGRTAWFDEVLDNAKYGECRGTGVLRREEAGWRVVRYHLVIPIPNEIAPDVVEMIRAAPIEP